MDLQQTKQSVAARHHTASRISPVASGRIRGLAVRVIEGAPALTAGEYANSPMLSSSTMRNPIIRLRYSDGFHRSGSATK